MLSDWFRTIELPMSRADFHRLPRHPAYKYEYFDGAAWLTPDPSYGRALLDLTADHLAGEPPGEALRDLADYPIRPLADRDWERLPDLMAAAFGRVPPFCALDEATAVAAARDCLRYTREGHDGPPILPACFVADGPRAWNDPAGAILITLIPASDLTEWHGMRWREPPPPDAIAHHRGRPHLTWIFTNPWIAGHGLGAELLRRGAAILREMGFTELASTFLIGNESSTTWHWRHGFRLLQHPGSRRKRV